MLWPVLQFPKLPTFTEIDKMICSWSKVHCRLFHLTPFAIKSASVDVQQTKIHYLRQRLLNSVWLFFRNTYYLTGRNFAWNHKPSACCVRGIKWNWYQHKQTWQQCILFAVYLSEDLYIKRVHFTVWKKSTTSEDQVTPKSIQTLPLYRENDMMGADSERVPRYHNIIWCRQHS